MVYRPAGMKFNMLDFVYLSLVLEKGFLVLEKTLYKALA